jgi:hypothetical protein
MKKDFKLPNINEIGRFAKESGLVKIGDDVSDVFERTKKYLNDVGSEIGSLIDKASGGEKVRGGDVAVEVLNAVDRRLGADPVARASGEMKFFDNLVDEVAKESYSAKDLHKLRQKIDGLINYKPGKIASEYPFKQQGLIEARNAINDIIGNLADAAEAGGAKGLKDLNKKFHMASNVSRISGDRAAAESANRLYSLTDYLVGGAAGGAAGLSTGGVGGLAAGLAAAQANKMARKYGPGLFMEGADLTGKYLQKASPKSFADALQILKAAGKGAQTKGQLDRDKRLKALE